MKQLNQNLKIFGLNETIVDFWAWAYSDILSNRNRSVFAEFLVGSALNALIKPRVEYNCVDICYDDKTIEVKCSAYVQSWPQDKHSIIKYGIGKKKVDVGSEYIPKDIQEPGRFADCYVFCLFNSKEKNKEKANMNILDISFWEFYVVLTSEINKKFENKESISLSSLQEISESVKYSELKACIDSKLGSIKN
ncbi:MAG: hypothetical protein O8C61_09590 [Candidatus Methanoperedens sp.]|nr:hypothetical protein [Candidatus Methanoperedens sp.]